MLILVIGYIVSCGIGISIGYAIAKHKIHIQAQEIDHTNFELEQQKINSIKQERILAETDIKTLNNQKNLLQEDITRLNNDSITLSNKIIEVRRNIDKDNEQFLEQAKERLNQKLTELEQIYQGKEEDYLKQYLQIIEDYTNSANAQMTELDNNRQIAQETLNDLQAKVTCGIEIAKRQEQERDKVNFYRLQLSEIDLEEIKRLREVEPYLRDKEALNKVIWKVYYEKPYQNLIGRVIGARTVSGIYKITDLTNSKCYIGQSYSISERWKQHIKRGIGAEPPTRNKLYPAMLATGVENFSFEIIEECPREKLNQEEKYWIDYFHSKEYGYNVTAGGA